MAYIPYGQNTTGGKQLAELMVALQDAAEKAQRLGDWISQIAGAGATNLETNTDFSVGSGQGQAFNDSFLQIAAAYAAFMGDGSAGTNREKIARFARGE